MTGGIQWENVNVAGAFVAGAILGSLATIRIMPRRLRRVPRCERRKDHDVNIRRKQMIAVISEGHALLADWLFLIAAVLPLTGSDFAYALKVITPKLLSSVGRDAGRTRSLRCGRRLARALIGASINGWLEKRITAVGRIDWNMKGRSGCMLSGPGGETIRRNPAPGSRCSTSGSDRSSGPNRRPESVDQCRHPIPPSEGVPSPTSRRGEPYGGYVEFGRGAIDLSGGRHTLHWEGRDGESTFRLKAGPVAATHFMENALDAASD